MQEQLQFKRGDLFFDSVWTLFCGYFGFTAFARKWKPEGKIKGRFHGQIVKELQFSQPTFLRDITVGKSIDEFQFVIDASQSTTNLTGTKLETGELLVLLCQVVFGHSYKVALPYIKKMYCDDRKTRWPPLFQFAYHIRNGCFHGNKFNIDQGAISTNIATEWRGAKITQTDNGRDVIGGLIYSGDVLTLLHDMQTYLR